VRIVIRCQKVLLNQSKLGQNASIDYDIVRVSQNNEVFGN